MLVVSHTTNLINWIDNLKSGKLKALWMLIRSGTFFLFVCLGGLPVAVESSGLHFTSRQIPEVGGSDSSEDRFHVPFGLPGS